MRAGVISSLQRIVENDSMGTSRDAFAAFFADSTDLRSSFVLGVTSVASLALINEP